MSALTALPRVGAIAAAGAMFGAVALVLPASAQAQDDRAFGQITSVSDGTFEVDSADGKTTVKFADTTPVNESVPAQLSDVTAGSCVMAGPGGEGAAAGQASVEATWVSIRDSAGGECPQWQASDTSGTQTGHRHVSGTVDSVSGTTITITETAGDGTTSRATVNVSGTTKYHKRTPSNTQAITAGKCSASHGTKGADDVLEATTITVWQPSDGKCPQPSH